MRLLAQYLQPQRELVDLLLGVCVDSFGLLIGWGDLQGFMALLDEARYKHLESLSREHLSHYALSSRYAQ